MIFELGTRAEGHSAPRVAALVRLGPAVVAAFVLREISYTCEGLVALVTVDVFPLVVHGTLVPGCHSLHRPLLPLHLEASRSISITTSLLSSTAAGQLGWRR